MTDQHPENNQVLHELLGLKPKRVRGLNMYSRMVTRFEYPNYAADPRLVLEGMREKNRLGDFLIFLCRERISVPESAYRIDANLILDRAGRLRDLAIDFLKEGKW